VAAERPDAGLEELARKKNRKSGLARSAQKEENTFD
jgi:hypothetical protein